MHKFGLFIGCLAAVLVAFTACKGDVANTGMSVLDKNDAIIVLADTFAFRSAIDSCDAIISQADSFLLGEIETDYGVLRASILTQLACPEGYHYPSGDQRRGRTAGDQCLYDGQEDIPLFRHLSHGPEYQRLLHA